MTTDLSVKLMTQKTDVCAQNARLLPDGCCFLSDKVNEILFRINISLPLTMITGLDGSWPPRSPDLTPMDFLWNHTETLIYASPVDSEEDHIACIVEAAT